MVALFSDSCVGDRVIPPYQQSLISPGFFVSGGIDNGGIEDDN